LTFTPNAILALVFSHKTPSINIFKKWISNFGNLDSENNIRCCVIKGVDKDNPTFYKFAITPNVDKSYLSKKGGRIITPSRFLIMESIDNRPLNCFLDKIKTMNNRYFLVPAIMKSETGEPEIIYDYVIRKCHLEVKNAWEIGKNDWWEFTILPDDKPFIPPMVSNAPVTELLKLKEQMKNSI
jgi:hypothetical protein